MKTIWTLDARDSVLLAFISQYFNLSDERVRALIAGAHENLIDELTSRGLTYESTMKALTPQRGNRQECTFLFDRQKISDNWYGRVVAKALLPTLDKRLTCSVLVGDLAHPHQEIAKTILENELVPAKESLIVETAQLYCVYLNNLSPAMAQSIDKELKSFGFYHGYINTTYSSPVKDWLSGTLVSAYVKAADKFICGHEDDAAKGTDSNLPNWPLEDFGYHYYSLPPALFDLFMSYKIERRVTKGFESDTRFSLNAISNEPLHMSNLKVLVKDAKLEYLVNNKSGSMGLAGIEGITVSQLSLILESKLRSNYIYNLSYLEESNTSKFNMVLEFIDPKTSRMRKFLAVMVYLPESKELSLVTLF